MAIGFFIILFSFSSPSTWYKPVCLGRCPCVFHSSMRQLSFWVSVKVSQCLICTVSLLVHIMKRWAGLLFCTSSVSTVTPQTAHTALLCHCICITVVLKSMNKVRSFILNCLIRVASFIMLVWFFFFHLEGLYQSSYKMCSKEREVRCDWPEQDRWTITQWKLCEIMTKDVKMNTRLPVTKSLETAIETNHTGVWILCGQFVI